MFANVSDAIDSRLLIQISRFRPTANTSKQTSVFQNIHPTQLVSAAIEHNAAYNVMDTEIWFLSDYRSMHGDSSEIAMDFERANLKPVSVSIRLRSYWFSICGCITTDVDQIKGFGNWRSETYPQYWPVDFA
uniref:Uncharacterized protein n=1 Tax=Glossina pallidipes TaxID=7398 RepID=A0A1A9ZFF0_GLOPL